MPKIASVILIGISKGMAPSGLDATLKLWGYIPFLKVSTFKEFEKIRRSLLYLLIGGVQPYSGFFQGPIFWHIKSALIPVKGDFLFFGKGKFGANFWGALRGF